MTNVVDTKSEAPGLSTSHRPSLVGGVAAFALLLVVVRGCSFYLSGRVGAGALQPDHDGHTFGPEVVAVGPTMLIVFVPWSAGDRWRRIA